MAGPYGENDLQVRVVNPTQRFISKIESGERGCDLIEVYNICKACKTDFVMFISALDKELEKISEKTPVN